MYSLTLAVGPIAWALMFKKQENAEAIKTLLRTSTGDSPLNFSDDFGHEIVCTRKDITCAIFEDMNQTKLAHVERMLHQTRIQGAAQKAAEADPAMRMSRMMNSPPSLMPMGPMPRQ